MDEFTYQELETELLPTREALNYWHPYGGGTWIAASNVAFAQTVNSWQANTSAVAAQVITTG